MKDQVEAGPPLSPESPTKRKVQFADVFGQSLVSVKMITPNNSLEDLAVKKTDQINFLRCDFQQPSSLASFRGRLQRQKVCLENIAFSGFAVTGTVLVKNICFAKDVTVRYSTDNWKTYKDVWADYVNQLDGGKEDRFQFRIYLLHSIHAGSSFEFAVRFRAGQTQYWDNNDNENYRVICVMDPTHVKKNNPGTG
ncbi:protein phosphatase 1 regulatory subunit 3C-like [Actinia tenebrosa]|uniref:Protein phosphatase 1 regulatory subunit 3C-like n=1 Tax=Actinia tenebrosa TaxID=6105 RepID=A0A6P8I6F4_ACTTE|nr:protein phosphatase 1 regulatory subunit 3C-like [Actinia tenebrosa]